MKTKEDIARRSHEYYLKNRDKILSRDKDNYYANIEETRSRARVYYYSHKAKMYTYNKKWASKNREARRRSSKEVRKRLRQLLINAYGGVCSCCGESEFSFLTLEHINRDGKLHRTQTNGGVYEDLKRKGFPKEGYTILCMNCNWGTKLGEICPHKLKLKELIPLLSAV